ncbi:hypothetical protein Q4I28_006532 [Leishmania naiffi]|uniref:Uncharacterized protein n=1 Tax=Leishmania naiffi TaxID=5678 RepID=A0AAW3BB27_9TRYP
MMIEDGDSADGRKGCFILANEMTKVNIANLQHQHTSFAYLFEVPAPSLRALGGAVHTDVVCKRTPQRRCCGEGDPSLYKCTEDRVCAARVVWSSALPPMTTPTRHTHPNVLTGMDLMQPVGGADFNQCVITSKFCTRPSREVVGQ